MANLFEIFLLNYKNPQDPLQYVKDVCKLRCIDKSTDKFAVFAIKSCNPVLPNRLGMLHPAIPSMRKEVKCSKCNLRNTRRTEPFTLKPTCQTCYPTYVTLTDAKKIYKLKDADLAKLDYTTVYIFSYRTHATLYQKSDIHALCLIKTGLTKPIVKERNAAREKRLKQYDALYKKYIATDHDDDDMSRCHMNDIFEEFLRNGASGVRKLEADMKKWPDFIQFIKMYHPTFEKSSIMSMFAQHILEDVSISELDSEIQRRKAYAKNVSATYKNIPAQFVKDYIETGNLKLEHYKNKIDDT